MLTSLVEESPATTSPRAVEISVVVSHAPTREGAWLTFPAPAFTNRLAYRQSTSLGPCFSNPTSVRVAFKPFCVRRPFVSDFLLCFLRPCTCNSLLSPSRTLQIILVTVLCCFSWFFHFYGYQRELIHISGSCSYAQRV